MRFFTYEKQAYEKKNVQNKLLKKYICTYIMYVDYYVNAKTCVNLLSHVRMTRL